MNIINRASKTLIWLGSDQLNAPRVGVVFVEMSAGFENSLGSISLKLLSPRCQLHRMVVPLSPSKVTVCFQNNRADHFSRLQRRIPLSVWSQPVNQEVIGSFQPLVRPWLRLHWMGEVRKRSKTSAFFSSGLIIDYRLGSRIHFASQQTDEERFSVLLLLLFRSAGTSFIE